MHMTPHGRKFVSRLASLLLLLISLSSALPVLGREEQQATEGNTDLDELEKQIIEKPTLTALVAYAYQISPLIKAARADWKAAIEKYRVDTALNDPEIMLEGMYLTEKFGAPYNPDDWEVSVTQALPLPGRLAKVGRIATTEAKIARLRLDSAIRDTTTRLRESYQELLYLREAKRLAAISREQLDQLRKVGETSTSDRTALIDILKAQAQSGQLQYDALLLQESEHTEQTRLNSIIDRNPDAPIGDLADEPMRAMAYSLQEIYPLAETNLEEIRIAQASISKAEDLVVLSRYANLPQFKLGVSYGELSQAQQIKVQAGFSLPLWVGKRAGRLGMAAADVEKMRAMRNAQINETRTVIRDTYFRLQNSERLVHLYRDDLLPQANRAMQTAETWFSKGQGSFSDYTETASVWYNFHLAIARAKADYGKFLAQMESLTGCPLTERSPDKNAPELLEKDQ